MMMKKKTNCNYCHPLLVLQSQSFSRPNFTFEILVTKKRLFNFGMKSVKVFRFYEKWIFGVKIQTFPLFEKWNSLGNFGVKIQFFFRNDFKSFGFKKEKLDFMAQFWRENSKGFDIWNSVTFCPIPILESNFICLDCQRKWLFVFTILWEGKYR